MPAEVRNTRTSQCRLGSGTLRQVSAGWRPEHEDRSVPAGVRNTRTGWNFPAGVKNLTVAGRAVSELSLPEHRVDWQQLYRSGLPPFPNDRSRPC